MNRTEPGGHVHESLGHRAMDELKLYWIVFAFLALMFAAFTTYRRLIMSEVGISYQHYGAGLIEAAIIAKVILVGRAMSLGKRFESRPLFVTVLVKTMLFGLLVALFSVLERVVEGMLRHQSWATILHRLAISGPDEILARTLMVLVAFLPFFALWEIGRVLGPGKLDEMFMHRRPA